MSSRCHFRDIFSCFCPPPPPPLPSSRRSSPGVSVKKAFCLCVAAHNSNTLQKTPADTFVRPAVCAQHKSRLAASAGILHLLMFYSYLKKKKSNKAVWLQSAGFASLRSGFWSCFYVTLLHLLCFSPASTVSPSCTTQGNGFDTKDESNIKKL